MHLIYESRDVQLQAQRPSAGASRSERLAQSLRIHVNGEMILETRRHQITAESCVVRNTDSRKGRTRSVEPGATAPRHLHYGRIILDKEDEAVRFATEEQKASLICLKGRATVSVEGNAFDLGRYDSPYIPRDSEVEVAAASEGCDLAEISAPVAGRYPLRMVSFADVQRDTALHFKTGSPSAERELNILIGKNVEAGRLLAGVTFSRPGNWTSWPPHEHAAMLEEAYLYIDMPAPAWGIQLVYTDPREPELAVVVREGDFVLKSRAGAFASPSGTRSASRAGDVLHFPSGCWHGTTMLDEEVVLIDIFTPVREDLLAQTS
jgi:5-deoxy-glucuronate isomerase